MKPSISVVIPAHNEGESIRRCISLVKRQRCQSKEIIVVDDASSDGTPGILKNVPGIRVVRNQRQMGIPASLNRGIAACRAGVIMTVYADISIEDPNWIASAMRLLERDGIAAVTGNCNILDRKRFSGSGYWEKVFILYRGIGSAAPSGVFKAGATSARCMLFKKSALERVGFFDESFRFAGEDIDMYAKFRKNGYAILYDGSLEATQHGGNSQSTFFKNLVKEVQYARPVPRLFAKHFRTVLADYAWSRLPIFALAGFFGLLLPALYWAHPASKLLFFMVVGVKTAHLAYRGLGHTGKLGFGVVPAMVLVGWLSFFLYVFGIFAGVPWIWKGQAQQ